MKTETTPKRKVISVTETTPKKRGRPAGRKNKYIGVSGYTDEEFKIQQQWNELEVPEWVVPPFYNRPPKMPIEEKVAWAVMIVSMIIIAVIIL